MWNGFGDINLELLQQRIDCRNILYAMRYQEFAEDFSFPAILKFVVDNSRESGYNKYRFAAMCRQIWREQEKE